MRKSYKFNKFVILLLGLAIGIGVIVSVVLVVFNSSSEETIDYSISSNTLSLSPESVSLAKLMSSSEYEDSSSLNSHATNGSSYFAEFTSVSLPSQQSDVTLESPAIEDNPVSDEMGIGLNEDVTPDTPKDEEVPVSDMSGKSTSDESNEGVTIVGTLITSNSVIENTTVNESDSSSEDESSKDAVTSNATSIPKVLSASIANIVSSVLDSSSEIAPIQSVEPVATPTPAVTSPVVTTPTPTVSPTSEIVNTPTPNQSAEDVEVPVSSEPVVTLSLSLSDLLVVGDSNTVKMWTFNTDIRNAKHVSAIGGVSVRTWVEYTNASCTTNGLTLYEDMQNLDSSYFNYVLIILGSNDYWHDYVNFTSSYVALLDYIVSRNPNALIIVSSIPPVAENTMGFTSEIVGSTNDKIRNVVYSYSKAKVLFMDLNSNLTTDDISVIDGVHLTEEGAKHAVEYISSFISNIEM